MSREALTAEQRAAYKTRADRVHEILDRIEQLEGWREVDLDGREQFIHCTVDRDLANRAWSLGIDTLIAQLEQELADLGKPQGIERFPIKSKSRSLNDIVADGLMDLPSDVTLRDATRCYEPRLSEASR